LRFATAQRILRRVRRLVLIVTCIAFLGVGAAVWISGASAGATVAHGQSPRLRQLSPRTLTVPQPIPNVCDVAAGSCSERPCTEFVAPSSAVYQAVVPSIVLASPRPAERSQCRPAARQLQRVGVGIAVARPAPVSARQTSSVQLVR
jgi:hypothetical protein